VKIGLAVRPEGKIEKKRSGQNSQVKYYHKVAILPQRRKMKLSGITILQGVEFPFSYWFLPGQHCSAKR